MATQPIRPFPSHHQETRGHANYNPFYLVLTPQQAKGPAASSRNLPIRGPHPVGEKLAHGPEGTDPFWDNVQLPTDENEALLRWANRNTTGLPNKYFGWVKICGPPIDPNSGKPLHPTTAVFHPRLFRFLPNQPNDTELCRHFANKGTCMHGSECHLRHNQSSMSTAACHQYLRRRCIRQGCRRIHGLDVNDPIGQDTKTPHVHPGTIPDLFTNSQVAPEWTFADNQRSPGGSWFPVPTTLRYIKGRNGEDWTTRTYGILAKDNWHPHTHPENPIISAVDHLAATVSNHRNIPAECGRDLLTQIMGVLDDLDTDIAQQ